MIDKGSLRLSARGCYFFHSSHITLLFVPSNVCLLSVHLF
jgi:hypothetical protein